MLWLLLHLLLWNILLVTMVVGWVVMPVSHGWRNGIQLTRYLWLTLCRFLDSTCQLDLVIQKNGHRLAEVKMVSLAVFLNEFMQFTHLVVFLRLSRYRV